MVHICEIILPDPHVRASTLKRSEQYKCVIITFRHIEYKTHMEMGVVLMIPL